MMVRLTLPPKKEKREGEQNEMKRKRKVQRSCTQQLVLTPFFALIP